MSDFSVVEFQKEYPVLNFKLSKNEKDYERGIIAIHVAELDKGFIVKKINKTTSKGTKVTYKFAKDEEEANNYVIKVNKMIDEFEEKFNTHLGFKLGAPVRVDNLQKGKGY
ncbi:hypothetical protein [Clostridium sp. B9]|uniref:hypothetical protein n=1 Tax=Clostridium sp. B9 TaxID=3423224 RepID=UPI003D2ED5AB